ncbi:MAG: tRNA-splicing ligase RtcB [Paraglaciecola sp.]|jgi:tRNA-splicing ligase RtcB
MDIGCRMCLTVYDLPPSFIEHNAFDLKNKLKENTRFGRKEFDVPLDDPIFSRSAFKGISTVRTLKGKAWKQIGSSGSGNHFVEFGVVEITKQSNELNVPIGKYLGILSHSGSRGMGAKIA